MRQIGILSLVLALTVAPLLEARSEVRGLKWSELSATVSNRSVTVVTATKARLKGQITAVRPDGIAMDIVATSDKGTYAVGSASIPRKDVAEVRIKEVKGYGRLIGAAGIGAAASLGSLAWAISDSRVNVSDSTRVASWAGITAAAVVGGYFVGRAIDTRETVFQIASGE